MIKKSCLVVAGLLMVSSAAHGEIYQWVDEKGSVHFSDQPQQPPARKSGAPTASPQAPQSAPTQAPRSAPTPRPGASLSGGAERPAGAKPDLPRSDASTIPKIRAMLRERKYAELNALFEKRQQAAEEDVRREEDLVAAFEAFAVKDAAFEALLGGWVEKYPQSSLPYLARAKYFYHMGWEARGTKWASETTEDQFRRMGEYFTRSGRDIQEALQRRAKGVLPYVMLLGMLGGSDEGAAKTVLAKALEVEPASFRVRLMYLAGATPRWGGTYEGMRAVIDEGMKHVGKNPRLALLQGYVLYDQGDMQAIESNYRNAEVLLTQALSYGDYARYLWRRAAVRYSIDKNEEALRDINRAIELWPHSGAYYLLRSKILVSLKRTGEALRDVEQADLLDPGDEDIAGQKKRVAGIFEWEGYDLQKKRDPQAAIGVYTRAAQATPESANIYVRRARALIDLNKLDEAFADLERAVDLDPNEIDTVLLIDWVLAKRGDWNRIIRYWDRYLSLHPDSGRAYVERGGAYFRKGDINAAVQDAKRSADLGDPTGREAYERFKGSVRR